jgi:hypothetical protein
MNRWSWGFRDYPQIRTRSERKARLFGLSRRPTLLDDDRWRMGRVGDYLLKDDGAVQPRFQRYLGSRRVLVPEELKAFPV